MTNDNEGVSKQFIIITYLIYIIFFEGFVWGGFGYVVFWLHQSKWLLVFALLLSSAAYSPSKWHHLISGKED